LQGLYVKASLEKVAKQFGLLLNLKHCPKYVCNESPQSVHTGMELHHFALETHRNGNTADDIIDFPSSVPKAIYNLNNEETMPFDNAGILNSIVTKFGWAMFCFEPFKILIEIAHFLDTRNSKNIITL
jgi:hypothetical protein